MPFLFKTPHTTGHGSLEAATAAVASELDLGRHYLLDGDDLTGEEISARLWASAAAYEVNGEVPPPISFCRSTKPDRPDEFRIAKRDASLDGVPYDSLSESDNNRH